MLSTETAAQKYDCLIQHLKRDRLNLLRLIHTLAAMTSLDRFEQINQLKTWLDSFRPLPPILVAELKQQYDVRLTYNSNAIEGNTLTQSETELVLTTGITIGGKTLREHLEVIGHKDAIDYIEQLAQQTTPIRDWEIKQIHNLILRSISPDEAGRYRQLDVRAAGTDYEYPPHYLLEELMSEFVEWLNSPEAIALHPVEYASEAHLRFVSIHPFRDGNGRAGRLLMNLLLLKTGYPIVIISNQVRKAYIDALVKAQQNQDPSSFLALVLEAVERSLIETLTILATAQTSRGQGSSFYEAILTFLQDHQA